MTWSPRSPAWPSAGRWPPRQWRWPPTAGAATCCAPRSSGSAPPGSPSAHRRPRARRPGRHRAHLRRDRRRPPLRPARREPLLGCVPRTPAGDLPRHAGRGPALPPCRRPRRTVHTVPGGAGRGGHRCRRQDRDGVHGGTVSSSIVDVKSQFDEAFERTDDVTGRLQGALVTLEEAEALVLSATDGSNNRAIEQIISALTETRETLEEALAALTSAVKEAQEYSASL